MYCLRFCIHSSQVNRQEFTSMFKCNELFLEFPNLPVNFQPLRFEFNKMGVCIKYNGGWGGVVADLAGICPLRVQKKLSNIH